MRWLRHTVSGIRRPAGRVRPARQLRRRPAIEPLEDRRLLATLDLELQLYTDDSGSRGAPIEYVRVGDAFFLSVTAEDQRSTGTPAGVIALPLDLQWRTDIISYPPEDPPPPLFPQPIPLPPPTVPNAVVTPNFLLQRFVNAFNVADVSDADANEILGLRGASLPAAGLGQAIGRAPPDPLDPLKSEFSLIHFEAVGAGWAMPFKMRLAGSMSFADAAPLDELAGADDAPNTDIVTRFVRVQAVASGVKYEDKNRNGERDEGEPGLPNWTVYAFVDDNEDGLLQESEYKDEQGNLKWYDRAVTDESGAYELELDTGLPSAEGSCPAGTPKHYIIVEDLKESWHQSDPKKEILDFDSDELGKLGYDIIVRPCDSNSHLRNLNFGNWRQVRISGYKWHDLNADGRPREAGEPGLPGWTIYVDYNDNGMKDEGEPSAITNENGNYEIAGIKPGTYKVREVPQEGWTCSYPNAGPGDADPDGVVWSTMCWHEETFTSGSRFTDNGFGNWTTATVEGVKFEDLNGDGKRDPGEPGLPEWRIFVDYDSNGVWDEEFEPSAITDEDGRYQIKNVKPGRWPICEQIDDGWINTDPEGRCHVRTFVSGGQYTDENFGNRVRRGSLSGFVYADVDKDAQRDLDERGAPIELGLPKVEIALLRDGQLVKTDWTGPDGWYHFEDLEPGIYDIVQVTQPACFIDGTETLGIILPAGESRGTAGNDRFTGITIHAGEHGIDYNFGELGLKASCVNKSMVLGSSNVRQAMVYDPCRVKSVEIQGTEEADTFSLTVGPTAISVTVNSNPPQTFPFTDVQIVSLNGLDGEDTITVTGSDADESAHFQPGYFAYRNEVCQVAPGGAVACEWDWAIEAIRFERVTANAGDSAGRDLAVLRDSTARDVLTATDGIATIDLSDQDWALLAYEHVRAISTRGGADETDVRPPLDFELELLGGWSAA